MGGCGQGVCEAGNCVCWPGWTGLKCELKACLPGCDEHGSCHPDGSCVCEKGWTGENCAIGEKILEAGENLQRDAPGAVEMEVAVWPRERRGGASAPRTDGDLTALFVWRNSVMT